MPATATDHAPTRSPGFTKEEAQIAILRGQCQGILEAWRAFKFWHSGPAQGTLDLRMQNLEKTLQQF